MANFAHVKFLLDIHKSHYFLSSKQGYSKFSSPLLHCIYMFSHARQQLATCTWVKTFYVFDTPASMFFQFSCQCNLPRITSHKTICFYQSVFNLSLLRIKSCKTVHKVLYIYLFSFIYILYIYIYIYTYIYTEGSHASVSGREMLLLCKVRQVR